MMPVWFALSQIAVQYGIGFRHFEIWRGSRDQPVGLLNPDLPIIWKGPSW